MPEKMCSCGTWNDMSASFCRNCGRDLRQNHKEQEPKKPSVKAGAILVVIIYYLVLIAVITGIVMIFV